MKPTKSVRWEVEQRSSEWKRWVYINHGNIKADMIGSLRHMKRRWPRLKFRIIRVTTTETREVVR